MIYNKLLCAKKDVWYQNISEISCKKKTKKFGVMPLFFISYTSNSVPDGYFIQPDLIIFQPQLCFRELEQDKSP